MIYSAENIDDILRLKFNGKFTYHDTKVTKEIITHIRNNDIKTVIIDLDILFFIDSTAIGMILIMVEECKTLGCKLSLINGDGQVGRVLKLVNIEKILC